MKQSSQMFGALLLLAITTGCDADTAPPAVSDEVEAAVAEAPVASPPSVGCGQAPPLAPGESGTFSMTAAELEREYVLHLPPTYEAGRPASLVLDFHGYTGTATGEENYTGLSRHADAHDFIVVYPQGTSFVAGVGDPITSWNDLAGSVSPGPEGPICSEAAFKYPPPPECGEPKPCVWATCHDDLSFVELLLDRLEGELCLDLDRIYATGMSNGGIFVHRLGCEMAERFAAIAPVAGTLARGFNCAPSTPLAMMNIYGTRDDYVSQKGVESTDGYYYTSSVDVLSRWAEAQGCDAETTAYPTSRDGVRGLACIQHDGCASGAEVVHCTWDGAHEWPAIVSEGGAESDSSDPDFGNQVIWEFFARHTRSGT